MQQRTSDPSPDKLVSFTSRAIVPRRWRQRRTTPWTVGLVVLASVITAGSLIAVPRYRASHSLLSRLGNARLPRNTVPRFSVTTAYRVCAPTVHGDSVPRVECPAANTELDATLDELQRQISRAADAGDHDGMHAQALLELALPDTTLRTVSHAIETLTRLAAIDDRSAEVLADLSAAYMLRAGRTNSPYDLFNALDAAERAVQLNPRYPAALFNRAVALEALMLDGEAGDAWREYARVDSASGWAVEARRHASALRLMTMAMPTAGGGESELVTFAGRASQEARELGWDRLLADWADSVLAGAAAEYPLHRAEIIGQALERRRGGDASLADAVRAIRANAGDRDATLRLAKAHQSYAAGRAALVHLNYTAALSFFRRARSYRGDSWPLDTWVKVDFAAAAFAPVRTVECLRLVGEAIADIDAMRYPALSARAMWVMGTMQGRLKQSKLSFAFHRGGSGLFIAAGEINNSVKELILASEMQRVLSERAEAYRSIYGIQGLLRRYRGSLGHHNALVYLTRWTTEDGLPLAGIRIGDETVRVARGSGDDVRIVEALETRASALNRAGGQQAAWHDIERADSLLPSLDSLARKRLEATLWVARAAAIIESDPDTATVQFTTALSDLQLAPARSLQVLLYRAQAYAARGQIDSAVVDLRSALTRIDQDRTSAGGGLTREVGSDARAAVDRVVQKLVKTGDAPQALALLERGLSALGQGGGAALPARLPGSVVAVRYALTGDTLLAFTMRGNVVRAHVTRLPRRELTEELDRVVSALERGDDEVARPGLERLYDWLIRPVEAQLGDTTHTVVVLPEGILTGVPFTALLDRDTGKYLVQTHPVRLAPSMQVVAAPRAPTTAVGASVFIQDPAFDRSEYPQLDRLDSAQVLYDTLASVSATRPVQVAGARATAERVRQLLQASAVVYFDGHAISDEVRPDNSHLVLARGADGKARGRLTAAEVARLDLANLQLVVLSACSTLEPAPGGGGGFAGLSGAFLNAGARGVVGSLWQVDEGLTSTLMQRFYREYARSGDPGAALRRAQLEMLNARDRADLTSPSAWAGFEYAGR